MGTSPQMEGPGPLESYPKAFRKIVAKINELSTWFGGISAGPGIQVTKSKNRTIISVLGIRRADGTPFDSSTIESRLTALETAISEAQTDILTVYGLASDAQDDATTALANSAAAQSDATTALADAAAAQTDATTALADAAAAQADATAALADAAAAQADADAANAAIAAFGTVTLTTCDGTVTVVTP